MKLIHLDDLHAARWSGGTTTQLAIDPPDSLYADRKFRWRLSTAVVEEEESVFTPLPDYNRLITTRKGRLLLKHNDGEWYELSPGDVASFDGGDRTESHGMVTDFNLMLRKDVVRGEMVWKEITAGGGKDTAYSFAAHFSGWKDAPRDSVLGIFLSDGDSLALSGPESALLHTGEMALFDGGEEFSGYWGRPSGTCHVIGVRIDSAGSGPAAD